MSVPPSRPHDPFTRIERPISIHACPCNVRYMSHGCNLATVVVSLRAMADEHRGACETHSRHWRMLSNSTRRGGNTSSPQMPSDCSWGVGRESGSILWQTRSLRHPPARSFGRCFPAINALNPCWSPGLIRAGCGRTSTSLNAARPHTGASPAALSPAKSNGCGSSCTSTTGQNCSPTPGSGCSPALTRSSNAASA